MKITAPFQKKKYIYIAKIHKDKFYTAFQKIEEAPRDPPYYTNGRI